MAYDNDSSGSSSHSSYQFAVECLNYFHNQKSVPKEKLVLGVPFYGRGYDESGSLDWNSYKSFAVGGAAAVAVVVLKKKKAE